MTLKTSLKNQVVLVCISLVILTSLTLFVIFWWTATDFHQKQINKQIDSAETVLVEYLNAKEQLLITAAKVLTADFGFKQAIATGDSETIGSVLNNHGSRINADLMILTDRDGELISSSDKRLLSTLKAQNSLNRLELSSIESQFILIDNTLYQVITLPIKAPRTIAYSIIGFEINDAVISELKKLTSLEITFFGQSNNIIISTNKNISNGEITEAFDKKTSGVLWWQRPMFSNRKLSLNQADGNVNVLISASLLSAYSEFDRLILTIFVLSLLILLLAITTSGYVAKNITHPLYHLVKMAQAFAGGNYYRQKPPRRSSTEVDRLYESFSEMGKEVQLREAEVLYQARHDLTTGLYNRHTLLEILSENLVSEREYVFMAINIRGFRRINDALGPDIGDQCLHAVANRLQDYKQSSFSIHGRLGGDEFMAVYSVEERQNSKTIVRNVQDLLAEPIIVKDLQLNLNYRIGVCLYPEHGQESKQLFRRTTIALDAASKEQQSVRMYQAGEDEEHLKRLAIIDELKQALKNDDGQLYINYQPKLNLEKNTVDKVESLIRWKKLDGSFVSPELFIGLAEKSGLIIELTHWVVKQVLMQLQNWRNDGLMMTAAINVSAQDLSHSEFLSFLLNQLDQFDVNPDQITLELTERDIMINEDLVIERLTQLKKIGITISVDDYGIGQSSLGKLKQLPVDELKIDKSFILKLSESDKDQKIVSSTIELGHKLGLSVVAEGVETESSLQLLQTMKCNHAQGYYLSRPVSSNEFVEWLQQRDA
ncbi:bifunctional diguanylate cyclase/phosphodiesterase [Pleionea mediterranea]|uniref:Diguanylate cyclase/phosphodiesterase n=1 Tax=Pleionea mediterranea TaxID=523701 RepID=A0A316FEQ9_9GAMM|nr:EAL domain-containing protein [Pleionea mediterranea]PWK46833.1 diguanylate cyclase/phosphodiesterase [Pleionea mediterranea]